MDYQSATLRGLAVGMSALLIASSAAMAHFDPPGPHVITQKVTVKRIEYAFNAGQGIPGTAGIPLSQIKVTYDSKVSEVEHGIVVKSFSLGTAVLPAKGWDRSDVIWDHFECAPMEGPLVVDVKLHFRYNGPGPVPAPGTSLYSSGSDLNGHAGSVPGFTEGWDLKLAGAKIGEAKVKYDVEIVEKVTQKCPV